MTFLLTLFDDQARHALNSRTVWNSKDGQFDNCTFFNTIWDLFDDPDDSWYKSTLQWWKE